MALDNIAQVLSGGFEEGQLALTSGAYPMGLAGSLSEGSSAGLYFVKGVRAANVQIPQPDVVTVMGNDRPLGAFLFPPGSLPSFDLDVAVVDLDLAAALEGVKVRDLDKWALHPVAATDVTYKDVMLLLSTQAQSKEAGSDGDSLWYHVLIPRARLAYLGLQGVNMRGENIARFRAMVRATDLYPWGEAIDEADEGSTSVPIFEWTSENKVSMDTIHLGDATTEITLSYTPAMSAVDAGNGILFYVNGTATALTGVTPGTKVATFAAQSQGDIGVVVYERAA